MSADETALTELGESKQQIKFKVYVQLTVVVFRSCVIIHPNKKSLATIISPRCRTHETVEIEQDLDLIISICKINTDLCIFSLDPFCYYSTVSAFTCQA